METRERIFGSLFLDRSQENGHLELDHFSFVGTVRELLPSGKLQNVATMHREHGTGNYVFSAFSGGHIARSNDGLPELDQIALLCIAAGF